MKREIEKCTLCGKNRNCKPWHYVINKEIKREVEVFSPGSTVTYHVGSKIYKSKKDTGIGVIKREITIAEGWSYICIPCRLKWTLLLSLLFITTFTFGFAAFYTGIHWIVTFFMKTEFTWPLSWKDVYPLAVCFASIIALYAITPFMRH